VARGTPVAKIRGPKALAYEGAKGGMSNCLHKSGGAGGRSRAWFGRTGGGAGSSVSLLAARSERFPVKGVVGMAPLKIGHAVNDSGIVDAVHVALIQIGTSSLY